MTILLWAGAQNKTVHKILKRLHLKGIKTKRYKNKNKKVRQTQKNSKLQHLPWLFAPSTLNVEIAKQHTSQMDNFNKLFFYSVHPSELCLTIKILKRYVVVALESNNWRYKLQIKKEQSININNFSCFNLILSFVPVPSR